MSTKFHGGSPLDSFPLNVPGFAGLNTQNRTSVLGAEWATRLQNTVLDEANRVASRKGWAKSTTTPAASGIAQMIEYRNSSGDLEIIASLKNDTMVRSADGGATWTAITGTATVSDPNMQLAILGNTVVGLQAGAAPILYTGTAFADAADASAPEGGVGIAAFGRIWAKDTATTISYSALLDATDWSSADSGTFDLTSVWPNQDEIRAIGQVNNILVIFGTRNIIMYSDNSGSALGIDPLQMVVVDTVEGTGCIARDSVQAVAGDLWFLDTSGVQNLRRLTSGEGSNPIDNITANVQDSLQQFARAATSETQIRAVYSPLDRFYLLSISLGSATVEAGATFCIDTRGLLEDGSARCAGVWTGLVPSAIIRRADRTLLIARKPHEGEVGVYSGYQDDGASYVLDYESGWNNLQTQERKLLKRVSALLFISGETPAVFKWAFDFSEAFNRQTVVFPSVAGVSEWGEAEWALGVFGGGVEVREKSVGGKGAGEFIKIGITVPIDGFPVAIQKMDLFAKRGKVR